jgi:hypothetical protein
MSTTLHQLLSGQVGNHLLPFLWLKGEKESVLRAEMARIDGAWVKA